jgi:GAF domain-containing protein
MLRARPFRCRHIAAQLDAAIEQAKAEGNLSRANVQIRSSYRAS